MEWDLLEKTTFQINGINLNDANLTEISEETSKILGLKPSELMIVDVRPGFIIFDVLKRSVKAESIAGKQKELLQTLQKLRGVTLDENCLVHSEGVLGLIALDEEEAKDMIYKSKILTDEVRNNIKKRAIVFASGEEVISKKIVDTNSPYIIDSLRNAGFKAEFGGILKDELKSTVIALKEAIEDGYGLIITTGGVGAEDKDFNIESICQLDNDAATPWILKFKPDFKRHHKDGVRIGVGQVGISTLVALPGPHEEAKIGIHRLIEGLEKGFNKAQLAEYIVSALRQRWQDMMSKGGD
ncbi:molybdopterin-binding protein [Thermoanaerobacterium thermosaccharolyticum]|uniref:molybdopterin-binding protein n=1 Tax=Thermoanaerobacterium thermosaccharolyticum TaxID=1517 RepID=UPI0020A5D56C|nr:molybdopterin-binding protein [Thermoanaerobacterium thermosaccharolyticum]MCP2238955.1 molybdenum cofactor synthesis domain-containing protein [Thermoanaerobacterium thermosaccharolyticum]